MTTIVTDQAIIAAGFARNSAILSIDGTFQTPKNFTLLHPWNLPSRMFQFPIETHKQPGGTRYAGLMHPRLAEHPFVRHVEQVLGVTIAPKGAPNEHGYTKQRLALWWHAVDLMASETWKGLMATRHLTTDEHIINAISYVLGSTNKPQATKKHPARGRISVPEARTILKELGADPPAPPLTLLHQFMAPSPAKQDHGAMAWPINDPFPRDGQHVHSAWRRIYGIEMGWLTYNRSGFLNWSQEGRARYTTGSTASTILDKKSGQYSLAF